MASSALKSFFNNEQYAVVGASTNRTKYGNRCLRWYQDHQLPVKPVHPSEAEIEGLPTVKALDDLADPSVTGISVITPPRVTLEILKRAKERQVPALWLQPGAEDAAVADFVRDNGMSDRVILGGPCILVLGEGLLSDAKRPKSSL